MTLPKIADWVAETTSTIGTGDIQLTGQITGFSPFSVMSDGKVYYTIQEGFNKEIGIGTFDSSNNTIKRTQVIATIVNNKYSTNATPMSLDGFGEVFCTISSHLINGVIDHITSSEKSISDINKELTKISGDLSGFVTHDELNSTEHNHFTKRDAPDSHPASAIAGIRDMRDELLGGLVYPVKPELTISNGSEIPSNENPYTNLRLSNGTKTKIVSMLPAASGAVSNLTEWGANIGGTSVKFIPSKNPNDPVSWGADPTGLLDSTDAFRRMSAAGIPAKKHNGVFRIDDLSSGPIKVPDGFDMSGSKVISNYIEGGDAFNRSSVIFIVNQELEDVTSDFLFADLVKGTTKVSNTKKHEGFIFFNSNKVQMRRNDNGQLSDVMRREANMILQSGELAYPMYLVFYTPTTTVGFKPFKESREYKFPDFEINGSIRTPVKTTRNNSKITIGIISQGSVDSMYTPHEFEECCLSELTEFTRPKSGSLASPRLVGYPALHNKCCAITYDSITANDNSGWGGIDGNYTRDILVKDSHITRISTHAFCSDIRVVNSTVYDQAPIHGFGLFEIINSRVSFRGTGYKALIQPREDFMASWDGRISIKNLIWDIIGSIDETRIVQCLPATYDGRPDGVTDFVAFEPTVQIDGITFNVMVPEPSRGYYVVTGLYLGGSGVDNSHLDKKRLPGDVCEIKNITVNSSANVVFNPVTNGRSYASVSNVPSLAKHNKFDLHIENWKATRHYTPENYNDSKLFGLQTFQFSGSSNIEQNYTVRDCDWVNVLYKTPDKCNVTFDGGKTLGARAAGFVDQPTVNVTTSLVTYKGGVNLVDPDTQVGGTPIKMPIAVESAIFRHGSYFTGVEPASLQTMGGNKFNSQVVLMIAGSAVVEKSSNLNEVVSSTLLNDATYGKAHSSYYEEMPTYTGTFSLNDGKVVTVLRGNIVNIV